MDKHKITLEESTHIYTNEATGLIVPSVTQVIDAVFPFKYGNKRAMQRGKAVHKAADLIDARILNWDSVHAEIKGYVHAYEKFRAEVKPRYVATEELVYNERHGYCGTLDRRTDRILYDIKTGGKSFTHGIQTAGYTEAVGLKLRRKCVYLKENGAYEIVTYNDKSDIYNFIACLRIYNLKKKEGILE